MAHVENRGTKAKPRFVAVYQDPDGKRRARSFTRKLDADRFLASTTVDLLRGQWVDPKAGRMAFGDYAKRWVDERPVRPSTRERYVAYLRYLGDLDRMPLGDLRPSTMRTWQAGLTCAPSTARTVRGVVAAILKSAVLDRLIAASPLDGVKLPPKPARTLVQPYNAERVLALRDAVTPRYAAAIILGAGCGLRRGEAFGLTVDRVDFLRRREITIDRQLVAVRAGRPVFGPPKTAASVRRVPAPQSVLDALAAHLARFPAGDDDGLVFTAPRGGAVSRSKVGEAWRDAEIRLWAREHGRPLARDGWRIPAATVDAWRDANPDGHGHRFHELRHFYVSTLIRSGASVRVVQDRIGHEPGSPETLRTYAHLWPDDDDHSRAAIDAALAPAVEVEHRIEQR